MGTHVTSRINLAVPSARWLWQKSTLKEPTVLQSFAFDDANKHLYVLQLTRGGGDAGDLCLNKLDHQGKRLGHMYLKGFGHGVSLGIQRDADDGSTWIWTEADAEGGYGQGVARFHFASGAVRTGADVKVRRPVPGSVNNQPSVCMASKRIAVRYRDASDEPRYRVWDLDAFVARDYDNPIADFAQTGAHPDPKIPFQGYALHRDHIYQLAGTAYHAKTNPAAKRGNAYVSSLDITTGEPAQGERTEAGYSLGFREPEGIAVRGGATPRVYLGFASGEHGARRFSIFVKKEGES